MEEGQGRSSGKRQEECRVRESVIRGSICPLVGMWEREESFKESLSI